jgi:soluble lytic murein transglycosylase
MTFNFKKTNRYAYYFDEKFANHKIIKPFLAMKRAYVVVALVVVSLFGVLFYLNIHVNESKERESLKSFIVAYAEINNLDNLSSSDYDLLAREVIKAARKYDIDPMLVLSVITVESSFDKDAVSSKGAVGLMQLMPYTAKNLCLEMGMSERNCKTSDVKANILIGTYYLSKLSSKYNNNMKHYLAAYNCGPSEVDRMLNEKEHVPTEFYSKILKIYQKLASRNV